MQFYRVIQDGISFGERSGEAGELGRAIEMAKRFMKEKPGSKFIVEKVERSWPPLPERKPGDNAIFASIHRDDTTGMNE
jgi:hypothetical protein